MFKIILFFSLLINVKCYAKTSVITGLDIQRFVSLKANEINLRVGPSVNYPIKIKYIRKNLPIEIIDEFDVWRKIKDHENNIGWIKKGLLKGDRFVLTGVKSSEIKLYSRPHGNEIGIIKKNNILKLETCLRYWCYISYEDIHGWVSKDNIWGVYEKKIYKIKFYQPLINQYWKILNSKWFN